MTLSKRVLYQVFDPDGSDRVFLQGVRERVRSEPRRTLHRVSSELARLHCTPMFLTVTASQTARLVPTAVAAVAASWTVSSTVASGGLRTSFIDDQRAPKKFLAIQARDGFSRRNIVTDFYKGKAARLAGIAIADNRDRVRVDSELGKFRTNILFRDAE